MVMSNHIAEHRLQTKHQIDSDSGTLRHVLRILQTTINDSLKKGSLLAPYKRLIDGLSKTNYERMTGQPTI